jgi:hypothetical protein
VQLHIWMIREEILDQLSFVRREVIQNNMNLLLGGAATDHFTQERDELCAGVPGGRFSVTLPVLVSRAAYSDSVP